MADALGFGVLVLPEAPSFKDALELIPAAARSRLPEDPEELKAEISEQLQVLCKT